MTAFDRRCRRALKLATRDKPWQRDFHESPLRGWAIARCLSWRTNWTSAGTPGLSADVVSSVLLANGEPVREVGAYLDVDKTITLYELPDKSVFAVQAVFVDLMSGMELRAVTSHSPIVLVGRKNGANRVACAAYEMPDLQ